MNQRDKKVRTCDFDYWVIFIYVNEDNISKVALFENKGRCFPYFTDESMSFDAVREKIEKELGITANDCFKGRYVSASRDVNYKENIELNVWASFIRVKDKKFLNPSVKKYKYFNWFTKEESVKKLKEKIFCVAFENIFTEDIFWESLEA